LRKTIEIKANNKPAFCSVSSDIAIPNSFFVKWSPRITRNEGKTCIFEQITRTAQITLKNAFLPQPYRYIWPLIRITILDVEEGNNPAENLPLHGLLDKVVLVDPLKPRAGTLIFGDTQIESGSTLFYYLTIPYETKGYIETFNMMKEALRKKRELV